MTIRLYENNTQTESNRTWVGANSLDLSDGAHFLKSTGNTVDKVGAWERIVWVNNTETTYDSDNVTVDKKKVTYVPDEAERLYEVEGNWQEIIFSWALITANTIDLDVNGVAMTQVPFNTSDAQTLADIATQIASDFATVASADAGTNKVLVYGADINSTVVITNVVVASWASQATASVVDLEFAETDETKYFDLIASDVVDMSTSSDTTGQVELVDALPDTKGAFQIVNL